MSNSGFKEITRYEDTTPAKRWGYGPREATGTLINSICMTLGGATAFALEELSRSSGTENLLLSSFESHPIMGTVTISLVYRILAYFFRNGGSSLIGDIVTKAWNKIFKKVKK